ncbi:MAG: aspartate--tRNA ligase, partial [Candidatus Absconditabacteria bacterium]
VLPQSPQQLKQLLMVSGFDRYCQIAKCFRDEDLRGDRQPEFTQFDMELSFVEQNDIISLIEKLFNGINNDLYSHRPIMANPFPVLTYDYVMNTFGIDKPELRTQELKLIDVSDVCLKSDLKLFVEIINNGGVVKGIVADKIYTRGVIDKFTAKLQEKGAKGLAYIIWDEEGPKSPILKFFSEELQIQLLEKLGAKKGTTCFFQATDLHSANEYLGYLRNLLISDMELTKENENKLAYAWVVDFPMFEIDEEGNFAAKHHPFTKPKDEFVPLINEKAEKLRSGEKLSESDLKQLMLVRADAYDLVLNGNEVAGGSIRIFDKNLQRDIFTLLGLSQEQIDDRFGHIIKAFQYGVPPHGGIAIGFDRLLMVLRNSSSIREVMPFPKTQKGEDLMLKAPSEIDDKLLKEIGFKIVTE